MNTHIPEQLFSILTRDVPEGLRSDSECRNACIGVLEELASPEDIEAVCIHEAGHRIHTAVFGTVIGFNEDHITMRGPHVHYYRSEDNRDHFEPLPGSVESPFDDLRIKYTTEIVKHLSYIAVAGGVYAGKFENRPNKGTDGDIKSFERYYRRAHTTLHAELGFLEASEYQKKAKDYLLKRLNEEPFLGLLAHRIAKDYKIRYFLPFLAHVTDTKNDSSPEETQTD